MKESIKLIENQIRAYDTWLGEFEGHTMYNEIKSKRDALASDIEVLSNNSVLNSIIDRRQLKLNFIRENSISIDSVLDKAIIDKYTKEVGLSAKTYWRDTARLLRSFIQKNSDDL